MPQKYLNINHHQYSIDKEGDSRSETARKGPQEDSPTKDAIQ